MYEAVILEKEYASKNVGEAIKFYPLLFSLTPPVTLHSACSIFFTLPVLPARQNLFTPTPAQSALKPVPFE